MASPTLPAPSTARTGWPWTEETDAARYYNLPRLPTVSVLVPSYNQGRFLEECLRSVLAQSYPHLQLMVADGGSTDETGEVLGYYAPYLDWYVSERDSGTWDADNKALERATGEYVLVVNSDDFLLRDGLYNLLECLLRQEGQNWATGRVRAVNEDGETKAVFTPAPWPGAVAGRTFLHECWIYHPATIVKRELIRRFAETDLMDWELWIRLEREGYMPAISRHAVAGLRFHASAKSFDSRGIYASQLRLLDRIAEHYPDRLTGERRLARRRQAEAEMVRQAEAGQRTGAISRWLGFALRHGVGLLANRAYLGLGKRLVTGRLDDLYRPMDFLNGPSIPSPDEEPCA